MKKIFFILMLFLFSAKSIAQNLENLKLRDTLYILFDENQKFDDLHLKNEKGPFNEIYIYVFPDEKYLSFDVNLIKEYKISFKKKKSFLNEKKSEIITIDYIHNMDYYKLIKLLSEKKLVIFIIDEKDFKRKRILLKRAYLLNIVPSVI